MRISLATLAITLGGCRDTSAPTPKCGFAGKSDVSVTGDVTASVNACAMYGVSSGSGASTVITLSAGTLTDPTDRIVLIRAGGRPLAGSYTVGAPSTADFGGMFILEGGSSDRTFDLTSGSIEITGSVDGSLVGTISAAGTEGSGTSAQTVAMSGSFTAKCVDTANTGC